MGGGPASIYAAHAMDAMEQFFQEASMALPTELITGQLNP